MKRTINIILSLLLVVAMLLPMAACGSEKNGSGQTSSGQTTNTNAGQSAEKTETGSSAVTDPVADVAEPTATDKTINVGFYSGTLVGSVDPYARNIAMDTYGLRALIYDPLFYPDPSTGEMVSDIVENYEWSDDYLELTLKLKDGIMFSNGEQMVGEDVIYSILNYQQGFGLGYYKCINCEKSFVDDDNLTVHLVYDYQYGPGIKKLDIFIGDKSFLETLDENADFYDVANAVGSGPYVLTELINETSSTFERKDNYWNDRVYPVKTYQCFMYTDQSTMTMDLENGVIDLAINASASDTNRLEETGAEYGLDVDIIGSGAVLILGLSDEVEELQDPKVREAICHAIDVNTLTQAVYDCLGTPATGYLAEGKDGYMDTSYTYDPELSRQLLEEAGVSDLNLFFATRSNGVYPAVSDVLQSFLSEVGINLSIEVSDFVTLRTTAYQEPGGTDFQCITNADGSPEGEGYFSLSPFEEQNIYVAFNKSDADFNASMAKIRDNVDQTTRDEGFKEVQSWLHDNYWAVPLAEWNFSVIYNSEVINSTNLLSYLKCDLRFLELA